MMRYVKLCVLVLALLLSMSGCKTPDLGLNSPQPEANVPLIQSVVDEDHFKKVGESNIEIPEKALVMQRTAIGVARNDQVEAYLNSILAKLQKAWPDENMPSYVFLIPSPEFNAFYYKGGIFIAHGMLSDMGSEDEVAACLAHEYSHALLGHDSLESGSELANRLYGAANIYLHVKYGKGDKTAGLFEQYLLNRAINEASQGALLPAFSREQEDDADALGTDLLIRAGYNPVAMTYLLQRVDDWELRNKKMAEESEARLAEVVQFNSSSSSSKMSGSMDISLDRIMDAIIKDLDKVYKEMQRQHYPASERERNVKEYIREYYADVPRDTLKENELQVVLKRKEVASFLTGLKKLEDSDQACHEKDTKKAKNSISLAYKTLHRDVAYARHISFEVAKLTRDAKVDQLEANCQKPDSLLRDHEALIRHYERREPKKALQLASGAYKEFDNPSWMLPTLVRLNKELDHDIMATIYLATCLANGDPQLYNMCADALK